MNLTIRQAAERLGRDQSTVSTMVRAGRLRNLNEGRTGPALVASADVQRVAFELRHAALKQRGDELEFARHIKSILWPDDAVVIRANGAPDPKSVELAMGRPRGHEALRFLPPDAVSVFGPDVVKAAAAKFTSGACRTCWARISADAHETLSPRNTPAFRELLGNPCPEDIKAWAVQDRAMRQQLSQLKERARVKADADLLRRFNADFRQAAADVQAATARFAELNRQRKAAGLPAPGRVRNGGRS